MTKFAHVIEPVGVGAVGLNRSGSIFPPALDDNVLNITLQLSDRGLNLTRFKLMWQIRMENKPDLTGRKYVFPSPANNSMVSLSFSLSNKYTEAPELNILLRKVALTCKQKLVTFVQTIFGQATQSHDLSALTCEQGELCVHQDLTLGGDIKLRLQFTLQLRDIRQLCDRNAEHFVAEVHLNIRSLSDSNFQLSNY